MEYIWVIDYDILSNGNQCSELLAFFDISKIDAWVLWDIIYQKNSTKYLYDITSFFISLNKLQISNDLNDFLCQVYYFLLLVFSDCWYPGQVICFNIFQYSCLNIHLSILPIIWRYYNEKTLNFIERDIIIICVLCIFLIY